MSGDFHFRNIAKSEAYRFSKIISLDITTERLGVSIAYHSERKDEVYKLNTISKSTSLSQLERNEQVLKELRSIFQQEKIDGYVVNWPLQLDGRFGKSCGKVLHFLDFLMRHNYLSTRRPFTLWDNRGPLSPSACLEFARDDTPDEWGRSLSFCSKSTTSLKVYKYSEDVSRKKKSSNDSSDALNVLRNFLDYHFRKESKNHDQKHVLPSAPHPPNPIHFLFEDYETKGAYIQANLL